MVTGQVLVLAWLIPALALAALTSGLAVLAWPRANGSGRVGLIVGVIVPLVWPVMAAIFVIVFIVTFAREYLGTPESLRK